MVWNRTLHPGRGVSPMIATILLVAITVVLAAVLYTLVSGLGAGSTDPRPIAVEFTILGNPDTSRGGVTWANFSLSPSQPVTTSEFGLTLATSGDLLIPSGSGNCTGGAGSCSQGSGWIAFLTNTQGTILNVWNASGWSNGTTAILPSMTLGFVAAPSLNVSGSGDFLKVISRAEPTVVGQSTQF